MDIKTEAEMVMWQLIRIMKTQKAVAKALGTPKQTFNYWLNYSKSVPKDQLRAMKELLQSKQAQQNGTSSQTHTLTPQKTAAEIAQLKLSERVRLAMEFEKELGRKAGRKGQKNKNTKLISPMLDAFSLSLSHIGEEVHEKKSLTCDELKGRTDVIAAKKFNIGSKGTYRHAQKVVLSNYFDLIDAMDEEIITVYHAAQLAELAPNVVRDLLAAGADAIIAFLKRRKQRLQDSDVQKIKLLDLSIFQNEKLLKAEHEFKLPLRSAFIGLISCCDECGGFKAQPTKLKKQILPYIAVDFDKFLNVLNQCGFIQKDETVSQDYWRIPCINQFVREVNHAEVVA